MLKIENLKKGDKLYCIKTYESTKPIIRDGSYYKRLYYLNNTDWSDLTEEEKIEHNNFDFRERQPYDDLIKDKIYKVICKLGPEITINTEISDITFCTYYKEDNYKDEKFLNEYFVSFIEGRKIKLQELSDDTFSNFLKKIKK